MLRITVDRARCVGAGRCVVTEPAVFGRSGEDGTVAPRTDRPGTEHLETVRRAVAVCPSGALGLVSEPAAEETIVDGGRGRLARLLTGNEVSVWALIGGWRGIGDLASPHVLFLAVYAVTQELAVALVSALGLAVLLALVRLARRESFWQAVGGLAAVAVSALIAAQTGHGEDFYLPNLLRGSALGVAFLVSMALRWPLVGVVVGPAVAPAGGSRSAWRRDRGLLRAFQWCTGIWATVIIVRLAVQIPLYLVRNVVALGIAHVLMGLPLFAVTLYACWRILRRAKESPA